MFKQLLRKYIELHGLHQNDLSKLTGDSQQAISDFLKNNSTPQKKTREKYFEKIEGFKDFYLLNTSKTQSLEHDELYLEYKGIKVPSNEILMWIHKNLDKLKLEEKGIYNLVFKDMVDEKVKEIIESAGFEVKYIKK